MGRGSASAAWRGRESARRSLAVPLRTRPVSGAPRTDGTGRGSGHAAARAPGPRTWLAALLPMRGWRRVPRRGRRGRRRKAVRVRAMAVGLWEWFRGVSQASGAKLTRAAGVCCAGVPIGRDRRLCGAAGGPAQHGFHRTAAAGSLTASAALLLPLAAALRRAWRGVGARCGVWVPLGAARRARPAGAFAGRSGRSVPVAVRLRGSLVGSCAVASGRGGARAEALLQSVGARASLFTQPMALKPLANPLRTHVLQPASYAVRRPLRLLCGVRRAVRAACGRSVGGAAGCAASAARLGRLPG